MSAESTPSTLTRLPWLDELVDYLKTHEDDLWSWFSTETDREKQAEAVRLDLLRTTYRIDRESQTQLYETADAVTAALGIDAPLTIYQAQQSPDLNATLKFVPGEIHVVLHGPLLETLDNGELKALLGHELSHYLLWTEWDSEILIAHEIILGMLNDPRGDEVHLETYRRLQLFTEVFCDRGGLLACGDLATAVRVEVKMQTGLKEVDAASYLQQAEEAASKNGDGTAGTFVTEGFSHPEAFLRVRAIQLWNSTTSTENSAAVENRVNASAVEQTIRRMIEGPLSLEQIDLPGQRHLTAVTRQVISEILEPAWMKSELAMSHARLFFPDIERAPTTPPAASAEPPFNIAVIIADGEKTLARYFSSILLDFVTADRDIQEAALAWATQKADAWGIAECFTEFATKELKLRKKQFQQIRTDAESLIKQAETSHSAT
jgi:hypothetical protein